MWMYLSRAIHRPYTGQSLTFYVTPKLLVMLEETWSHINNIQTFRFFCILPNTLFSYFLYLLDHMLFFPFPFLFHSFFSSMFFSPLSDPISLLLLLTIFFSGWYIVYSSWISLETDDIEHLFKCSRRINNNKKGIITKTSIII